MAELPDHQPIVVEDTGESMNPRDYAATFISPFAVVGGMPTGEQLMGIVQGLAGAAKDLFTSAGRALHVRRDHPSIASAEQIQRRVEETVESTEHPML